MHVCVCASPSSMGALQPTENSIISLTEEQSEGDCDVCTKPSACNHFNTNRCRKCKHMHINTHLESRCLCPCECPRQFERR
eukprot:m.79353 g.79353  ORF g.79353 m.79353 type:complete len:81 (-) comp11975_c1_seq32:1893-2135(-)